MFQHSNIQLCIKNLKYTYLTPLFQLQNIHFVISTCPHKYKWILCNVYWKTVLNGCIQDLISNVQKKKIIWFVWKNDIRLKIPYTQHEFLPFNMYLLSFSKKSDAKIYTAWPKDTISAISTISCLKI